MVIEINLKSHAESKIAHLIAFLRSIDFVENVKITPDPPVNTPKKDVSFFDQFYGSTSELNVTEFESYLNESRNEWERPPFKQSRFDKYNGVWKNKLSMDEIDEQLNTLRNEWERTI